MTYLWMLLIFVGIAAVVAGISYRRRRPPVRWFAACLLAAAALFVLTTVFDSVMIAADLFTYGDGHILGPRVALVPIEDYSYPLAAIVLLPAVWVALGGERDR